MLRRRFPRLYWRIGAVARITGIPQQTLRSWEREFRQLHPRRDASGVRVYRDRDFRVVLLLQNLIERDGRSIPEVRSFLDEDPVRTNALLDGIDLEAALGTKRKGEPSPAEHRDTSMSGDGELDKRERHALEEPGEPDPWHDAALKELETGRNGATVAGNGPPASAPAATAPEGEAGTPPSPDGERASPGEPSPAEAGPTPQREPLPAWAVAELHALRNELVALEQMIAAIASESPAGDDRASTDDGE